MAKTILGVTARPSLGTTPGYTASLPTVPGLAAIDRTVLYEAVQRSVDENEGLYGDPRFDIEPFAERLASHNERRWRSDELATATGVPEHVVCHMLRAWAARGWLKLSGELGSGEQLWEVSVQFRRWLQS